MELMSIVGVLAGRRILVLLGALVAIAVGLAAMDAVPIGPAVGGARTTGMARSRILVDTPHSLVGDLRARADTIGAQAALLSDLLAGGEQVRAIARRAGVAPGSLVVLRPAATMPTKPSPLAEDASVAAATPAPATVTVRTSTALPIVTIEAVAPDRATAARLAGAASAALRSLAAEQAPSPPRALVVTELEPVRSVAVVSGAGRRVPLALGGALMAFALWCGAIVVLSGLAGAWRGIATPAAGARG
jgi:hypothetical protein